VCEYKGLRGGLCDLIPRSLLVFRFYLNSEEKSLVDVGIVLPNHVNSCVFSFSRYRFSFHYLVCVFIPLRVKSQQVVSERRILCRSVYSP